MLLLEVIGYSLLLVFLIVLGAVIVVHLAQEVTGRAPFIPISNDVMGDIIAALELAPRSVMYDLGSGDGRVVIAAAKAHPEARTAGIERSYLPYIISLVERRRGKAANARFIRASFFDVSITDATHVFLYLFPSVMNMLLPKFEKELAPGTRVISCDFKFSNKAPSKIIDLKRTKYDLGRKIYIYEF